MVETYKLIRKIPVGTRPPVYQQLYEGTEAQALRLKQYWDSRSLRGISTPEYIITTKSAEDFKERLS